MTQLKVVARNASPKRYVTPLAPSTRFTEFPKATRSTSITLMIRTIVSVMSANRMKNPTSAAA